MSKSGKSEVDDVHCLFLELWAVTTCIMSPVYILHKRGERWSHLARNLLWIKVWLI